ncbi:MAG: YqhA family protein [Acidimicrobiia bacterium]
MKAVIERSRYLVAVASIASALLAVIAFVWAVVAGVELVHDLVVKNGWKAAGTVAELLGVLDLLLVGTTLVVLAIGLWELFVGDLAEPEWLRIDTLDDLKVKVAELVVLVVAVKFFEKCLLAKQPSDIVYYSVGVVLIGGTLIAFSTLRARSH